MVGASYMRNPGHRAIPCQCDCGTQQDVLVFSLRNGKSVSCGCWKREDLAARKPSTKHGLSKTHVLYPLWKRIRRRCYDTDTHNYKHYGGRGIRMYDEWRDDAGAFIRWVEANLGPRPTGMSLDRIDNNGDYEPGNLRWATQAEQNQNKRAPNGYPAPS